MESSVKIVSLFSKPNEQTGKTISYCKKSNKPTKKRRERRLGQEKQHNMDDKTEHQQRQKNKKILNLRDIYIFFLFIF